KWKEKHGGIILEQLKKLGASCDWKRTKFTMDAPMSESVIKVFVDLFNKGLIYRGVRMVNWDPEALTALSDEEVIYSEVNSKLYYLRYKIEGSNEYVVVATTRPETILGDSALCVNPNDPRYNNLKRKRVIVPLVGRSIPVIYDEYVDIEFGTGALKVTPAHDVNDYMLGEKYNLEVIDIFNDNGTINDKVGMYVGMDRAVCRDVIIKDIDAASLLEKTEDYTNKVGLSERTNAVIEPKLSMQWFMKMEDISKPALKAVMDDEIALFPAKFKNTYRYWMENVKDWCVSRQLWWGQQIPAYYLPQGGYVVAESPEEALEIAKEKTGNKNLTATDLRRDPDVLDTWFSSWLWPISVFDGIRNPENKEINYYYPTNDLVTAPEILFFWVARMIIAGYEYRGERPFKNVYLTGIVRDKLRRKMSKSLGNSPDPLVLIKKYGADSVRMAMMLCSGAGNDLMFDESLIEQGRNFGNKIWNSFRLIKGWECKDIQQPVSSALAVKWFNDILNKNIGEIDEAFSQYRISEALMQIYKLFWDEFSSWYLEMIKPAFGEPIDSTTHKATIAIFEKLLHLIHPFMPFITEELWHFIAPRKEGESIMVSAMPKAEKFSDDTISDVEFMKEVISAVRNIRKEKGMANREPLDLFVVAGDSFSQRYIPLLSKMANLSIVEITTEKPQGALSSFLVKTSEFYVPLGESVNIEEEIDKLSGELKYLEGFLVSVDKKLSNERFVKSAPEAVVATERAKKADAESKIASLKEQIAQYKQAK
ncbi:MAG: valine--tRNA ligase, partial [Rikenellaceae bacterium]